MMTDRAFRRQITEARRAYRLERDEALVRAAAAEHRAEQMMDALAQARAERDITSQGRRLRILIEADDLLGYYRPIDNELRQLAERITLALVGLANNRDYRGDFRQTNAQRILGVSSTWR